MKLETSIQLTADGKVTVQGLDGKDYVFRPEPDGSVVGDVDHEDTLVHLLTHRGTRFWPADEADYETAQRLLDQSVDAGPDDDDGPDGPDDDEVIGDGAPVESKTPPAVIPGRKPRKPRATAANT